MPSGERNQGGVEISDRRTSGKTFADAVGSDTNIPSDGASQYFFDDVRIFETSSDKQHALVLGLDEDQQVLLRDWRPIFKMDNPNVIHGVVTNEDLSRVVVTEMAANNQRKIYLIDHEGKNTFLESGNDAELIWNSENFDDFWISKRVVTATFTEGTMFHHKKIVDGKVEIKGSFTAGRYLYNPKVLGVSADRSELLWRAYKRERTFVYRNENKIVSANTISVRANSDISAMLFSFSSGDNTEVWFGKKAGGDKLAWKFSGIMKGSTNSIKNNVDVSRAAVLIRDTRSRSEFLLFLVDGKFVRSKSFKQLQDLTLEDDGHIVAKVLRNYAGQDVERVITVPARDESDRSDEPPQVEDTAA